MLRAFAVPASLALAFSFSVIAHAAAEDNVPAAGDGVMERLTRIQIFLDARDFGPGRLDGKWGEFTRKALARYLESQGKPVPEFGDTPPADLDLKIDESAPAFIDYTVTEKDVSSIGEVPDKPEQQAEQKAMPYTSVLERVAERFHSDPDFLKQLNPDAKADNIPAGAVLKVPNISPPFDLEEVAQRAGDEGGEKKSEGKAGEGSGPHIVIDVAEKMLEVRQGETLAAAFPITPGSDSLPAPEGDWKIDSITWMPWFRYDKKMLQEGERSDDAHNIPPGPNNAVGIAWIALNKKGIGIHGTNSPDTIGRSSSHGCIRLANWDAWKVGNMVPAGTAVTIK